MKYPYETPKSFSVKAISGIVAGLSGALVIFVLYFGAKNVIEPVFLRTMSVASQPFFPLILMGMVFTGVLISNIIGATLMVFAKHKSKFANIKTAKQVFLHTIIINSSIFAMLIPGYIIAPQWAAAVAWTHITLTVLASMLLYHVVTDSRHIIVGLYAGITGILLSSWGMIFLIEETQSWSIGLLAALPVIWTVMGLLDGLLGLFYAKLARRFSSDFLALGKK